MDATITFYESMSRLSHEMAEAARANDWDELCRLEKEVASIRDTLARQDPPQRQRTLDETDRQRKISLIRQILADDREIRTHAEPWMENVRAMLSSGSRQRALSSAYGMPAS